MVMILYTPIVQLLRLWHCTSLALLAVSSYYGADVIDALESSWLMVTSLNASSPDGLDLLWSFGSTFLLLHHEHKLSMFNIFFRFASSIKYIYQLDLFRIFSFYLWFSTSNCIKFWLPNFISRISLNEMDENSSSPSPRRSKIKTVRNTNYRSLR